jgi:hypothetical protein
LSVLEQEMEVVKAKGDTAIDTMMDGKYNIVVSIIHLFLFRISRR